MVIMASTDWQLECVELSQRGSHILQSGLWSDCTFRVRDQIIKAHRLILAMASPVFATMFYGSMSDTDPILIEDVDPDIFKALLEYIYTNKIVVSSFDVAYGLCYAAKKYMLPNLVKKCSTFLSKHLSPQNACKTYELASLLDDSLLMDKCLRIISSNTGEVLNDSSFMEIEPTTVFQVLSLETMNIESEIELVNAVTRYNKDRVESAPESTTTPTALNTSGQFIKDALGKIRLLTLTPQQFAEDPSLSSLLTSEERFAVLMNVSSSKSDVPMPDGFNVSRQTRSSGKCINNVLSKVSSIESLYCTRKFTTIPGIDFSVKTHGALYFKPDQAVTLVGVQIPSQETETSCSETYQENIKIFLQQKSGNNYTIIHKFTFNDETSYNGLMDVRFPTPVALQRGQEYWLALLFYVEGQYPRGECSLTAAGDAGPARVKFDITRDYRYGDLVRSLIIQKPNSGT